MDEKLRSFGCPTTGVSRVFRPDASVNHLTIDAVDPGAGTQETKACLVNVIKMHKAAHVADRAKPAGTNEHDVKPATRAPIKATLVDITKCIGCRACQVACKQWNDREGELTEFQSDLGFQNPATLSAKTLTLITFHELPDETAPGGLQLPFHHAAMSALPGARMRLSLPHNSSDQAARRPCHLRCQ